MDKPLSQNRIVWLDAIKLFACVMIFFGHFNGVFAYGSLCEKEAPVVFWQYNRFVKTILNGNFWICVFCFISGFLIARKKIPSLKTLASELFLRYLRFALQFFCAAVIAWIIYLTVGYPTEKFADMLGNDELLSFYNYKVTFMHVLKTAFIYWKGLLPTIWMIWTLFAGNAAVLVLNWCFGKADKWIKASSYIAVSVILCLILWHKVDNPKFLLCCILGAVPGILIDKPPEFMSRPDSWKKIGEIPFSVYLLHMPIIYSLSLYFFGFLYEKHLSYYLSYFICLIATFLIVMAASVLFSKYIGKFINKIILSVKGKINSIGGAPD